MRAAAYLHAGDAQQAVKDLRVALVYGPQQEDGPTSQAQQAKQTSTGSSSALVKRPGGAGKEEPEAAPQEPPPPPPLEAAGRLSGWPAALGLFSAALEALADNVPAVLAAQRVRCQLGLVPCGHGLCMQHVLPWLRSSDSCHWQSDLARLVYCRATLFSARCAGPPAGP